MNDLILFIFSKVFWKNVLKAACFFIGILLIVFIWLRIYTHHYESISVPDFTGLTKQECQALAAKKGLRISIIDSVFMQAVPRGTMVEQNPKAGFKVKKNRTIFLTMNAINPEKIKMPNVVGFSLRQASAILETKGLAVGHIIYVPDIAMNEVLRQQYAGRDISGNTLIIKGSRIDLVLGNGLSAQETYVPNLRGLNLHEGEQRVIESYLNLGAVIYDNTIMNLQDSLNARIFKQRPSGGMVSMGSSVDIWLTIASSLLPAPDSSSTQDPTKE